MEPYMDEMLQNSRYNKHPLTLYQTLTNWWKRNTKNF